MSHKDLHIIKSLGKVLRFDPCDTNILAHGMANSWSDFFLWTVNLAELDE